jgi:hypothetical protein
MRTLRTIMTLCFLFTTGCASVKTTGQPFCPNEQIPELINYLDNGLNKVTKKDIRKKISAVPEVFANEKFENWTYSNSSAKNKLTVGPLYLTKTEKSYIRELVLTFNKQGVLTSYRLKNEPKETVEKSDHGYKIGEGIVMGFISGLVFALISSITEKAKK